jgi:bifunctional non-homologous end joining protein LigD
MPVKTSPRRPDRSDTSIKSYDAKRDFKRTPEPAAKRSATKPRSLRFVIQLHDATQLHYDFRLEADGVLKSWAVPRGPSLDPADKRLAMRVEDHPLEYRTFEGIIPKGNYGAGEVIVWDSGTYKPQTAVAPEKSIDNGQIKFTLRGKKLKGNFALVKMHGRDGADNAWLLVKERDEFVDKRWRAAAHAESVKSGRTLADIRKAKRVAHWTSNRTSSDRG